MSATRLVLEKRLREIGLTDDQVGQVIDAIRDWINTIFRREEA